LSEIVVAKVIANPVKIAMGIKYGPAMSCPEDQPRMNANKKRKYGPIPVSVCASLRIPAPLRWVFEARFAPSPLEGHDLTVRKGYRLDTKTRLTISVTGHTFAVAGFSAMLPLDSHSTVNT